LESSNGAARLASDRRWVVLLTRYQRPKAI
jgi:hypothetical protein